MKSVPVKPSTYVDFGKENNDKDCKFEVGDHERISKYKNIFAKDYAPEWYEEVFITLQIGMRKCLLLKKLKILCYVHM